MHQPAFVQEVLGMIPEAEVITLPGSHRHDVVALLPPSGNLGIELGVAAGSFSAAMVASGRFQRFWGVDAYGDGHNLKEYKKALLAVGLEADYRLLRMEFSQALDLFPEQYFDFIYCDGYAHTGEEGGRTLAQWYRKLKPGGILAGDDYAPDTWPLVVWAVHEVARQLRQPVYVTDEVSAAAYNRYPSWYLQRPLAAPAELETALALELLADAEKERIAAWRKARRQARRLAQSKG